MARRLANYVLLCLVATFLAFALGSLTFSPLGQLQGRNPPPPASVIQAKWTELRLGEPIPTRFMAWMGGVVHGDFGATIIGQPVTGELTSRIGVSLRLFTLGAVLGIAVGVLVGVAGAIRQYRASDYAATLLSFPVLSIPVFLIGTLVKFGGLAQRVNRHHGAVLHRRVHSRLPGWSCWSARSSRASRRPRWSPLVAEWLGPPRGRTAR